MLSGTNKLSYNLNDPRFRNNPYIGQHNSFVFSLKCGFIKHEQGPLVGDPYAI